MITMPKDKVARMTATDELGNVTSLFRQETVLRGKAELRAAAIQVQRAEVLVNGIHTPSEPHTIDARIARR